MATSDIRADEWISVYEVGSRPHAEIVVGALRANGIAAHVLTGDFDSSGYPGLGSARVMVQAKDAPKARHLITEVERQGDET